MVRLGRILRDYRDTGAINGLLALWGFVDETTFLTKAGHVGVVLAAGDRLRGSHARTARGTCPQVRSGPASAR